MIARSEIVEGKFLFFVGQKIYRPLRKRILRSVILVQQRIISARGFIFFYAHNFLVFCDNETVALTVGNKSLTRCLVEVNYGFFCITVGINNHGHNLSGFVAQKIIKFLVNYNSIFDSCAGGNGIGIKPKVMNIIFNLVGVSNKARNIVA